VNATGTQDFVYNQIHLRLLALFTKNNFAMLSSERAIGVVFLYKINQSSS